MPVRVPGRLAGRHAALVKAPIAWYTPQSMSSAFRSPHA
jgi:hypothetical protein